MTPSLVLSGRGQGAGKSRLLPSTFHRLPTPALLPPPSGFPLPASRYPASVHLHLQVHESLHHPPLATRHPLPKSKIRNPKFEFPISQLPPSTKSEIQNIKYKTLSFLTPKTSCGGFALVATLLMITVITGAAVAFFQSTRIERFVARNYADLARAQLAAEGAAAAGQALITSLFTNYPDSAVGWARLADTELATFYFRTTNANGFLTNGANTATPASQPVFLFAYPLASGANAVQVSAFSASAPVFTNTATPGGQAGLTAANRVDLNSDNWIGTPPGGTKPALRAKWIEILKDPSQPKNTNLNSAGFPINPAIARYAFWAEDESFRVNINRAGANPRGNNTPGTNPAEIALQGALSGNNAILAQGVTNLQVALRSNIPTPATMGLANPSNNYTNNRFVVSVHSSGLNLSRGGTLRLNLNQVVTSSTDATTIRSQLDRVLAGITNANTNAAPSNTAAMPNFGQRFYRASPISSNSLNSITVPTNEAASYLEKVAANIHDYIDTDSQPTIVNQNFSIRTNSSPINEFDGNSDIRAIGKEPLPLLTEYGLRVVRTRWDPVGAGADYEFFVYHYLEFWNPTTNSISLTNPALANATLDIYNMYNFDVGGTGTRFIQIGINDPSGPVALPRVLNIPLTNFSGLVSFPANSFTVLTTDSTPVSPANVTFIANNYSLRYFGRSVTNQIRAQVGSSFGRAGTTSTDYDLRFRLYNSSGLLDSFAALATVPTIGAPPLRISAGFTQDIMYCSLRGNTNSGYTGRSGDPRSLNEQQVVLKYGTGSDSDQTRFYNSSFNSFGALNGTTAYVFPTNWSDWSPAAPVGAALAPYRHLNSNLPTIGFLGDVYDPAFMSETSSSTLISRKRGGGRTLKIGQSDFWNTSLNPNAVWDGSETSTSRNWTSWRLADVFSVTNSTNLPGVININGALRDNGAALQALVFGLIYESSPSGAQATSGRNLNVANFVTAVRNHLAGGTVDTNPSNDRLFWERGQLGELADSQNRPLLSSPLNTLAGVALSTTKDRGREELVRRMMELITTKGNVYTIYAIGQSLNPRTGHPVATQKMKRTFRIDPTFNPALPADNTFDPAQAGTGSATDRFRRPSRFTITVLQNSVE